MRQMQRMVLMVLASVVFMIPAYIRYAQHRYYMECFCGAQEELFFDRICRTGILTAAQYEDYRRMQVAIGNDGFRIQEYRTEYGREGKAYDYLLTWEEIREVLAQEGRFSFEERSEIRLYTENKVYCGQIRARR